MIAMVDDKSRRVRPRRFDCREPRKIHKYLLDQRPFKVVIEASGSYRWLYDLLSPDGEVVIAHPLRLRAIWSGRAKTDKLDAKVLADLLRGDLIPESYVPPEQYQTLRDITRARSRLVCGRTQAGNSVHAILAAANIEPPYKNCLGPRGLKWISSIEFGRVTGFIRDELVQRLAHFNAAVKRTDKLLDEIAPDYPEIEAIIDIRGIGLYSALLIVAEIAETDRFTNPSQVSASTGLTPRVRQSGQCDFHGPVSKQGSRWFRWILVEAAMKVIKGDRRLRNFYLRVKRRAGFARARVAVARKLSEICWKRLCDWHKAHKADETNEADQAK
jgi:transposase